VLTAVLVLSAISATTGVIGCVQRHLSLRYMRRGGNCDCG
jgi:hypothetical protein